ncbi:MAG: hypothetical protein ABIK28_01505, partial [Planctomycetota bacterium]
MEPLRKYIGLFILVFLGIPALTVVIGFAGITRALTCPTFIPNLPATVCAELPEAVDLLFETARHPSSIEPENLRQWILAASQAETRPSWLLEQTGFMTWLREDLSEALERIFLILKGEVPPHNVTLDLRPLKTAFMHPAIDRYFMEIVDLLPPATADEEKIWQAIAQGNRHYRGCRNGLPACKPNNDATVEAVAARLKQRKADLPDREIIFEGEEIETSGFDILLIAQILGYLLFMVPGFIIAFGAFIAEPLSFRCFRWSGIPIMVSALIASAFAVLPGAILKIMSLLLGWIGSIYHEPAAWSPSLISQGIDKLSTVLSVVMDPLFSPVISTALFTGLFGAFLYGLACLSDRRAPRPY